MISKNELTVETEKPYIDYWTGEVVMTFMKYMNLTTSMGSKVEAVLAFDLMSNLFIDELAAISKNTNLNYKMFFIATSMDLKLMTRAVDNSPLGISNDEVTPLVNFLVNATSDASELEQLRKQFNETVSP